MEGHMPSTLAGFGLRPSYHPSGQINTESFRIASAYAATIYRGQLVKLATDGTIAVAANGEASIGVFVGCEYEANDGSARTVRNKWTASTTLKTGTVAEAFVVCDPEVIYEMQADDSSLDVTNIGNCGDVVATGANGYDDGNSTTGLSEACFDASTASTTMAQLQIIGFARYVDNDPTDTYPIVLVKISEHQLRAAASAGV
jgi:uncharacterized surface anchored protein